MRAISGSPGSASASTSSAVSSACSAAPERARKWSSRFRSHERRPMKAPEPIHIMIVDDHPVVREGFASMIGTEPDMILVAEARDGEQARELFRQHHPDVTLMDLRMPGLNGVDTIRSIRREFPQSRFIVLTTYDGDEDIYRALEAGAQAYLLKD